MRSSSLHSAAYIRLVTWFLDNPSAEAPFSVHRFAAEGEKLGKQVGEWFGPSTAAGAIKSLANAFEPANLGVALAIDTTVYRSEVFGVAACGNSDVTQWNRPVLILVPLRLGLNGVNPIYFSSIKHYFMLPQCVGIAGGRPSSSYYFVGAQGDSLFYIDPHHTRPSIKAVPVPSQLDDAARNLSLSASSVRPESDREYRARAELDAFFMNSYLPADLTSFHCDKVRKMPLAGLDPSMLVGLLCKKREDWEDLCSRMREIASQATPIIHIVQEMPAWMLNPSRSLGRTAGRSASYASSTAVRTDIRNLTASGGAEAQAGAGKNVDKGNSMEYVDSDDWDIDDSDADSNLGPESTESSSAAPAQPNLPITYNLAAEEVDKIRLEATQYQSRSPQSLPALPATDSETDAVFILPPSQESLQVIPSPLLHSLERAPLEPEDRAAGWEGMTLGDKIAPSSSQLLTDSKVIQFSG